MEPVAKVSLKIQRAQGLPGEFLSAADGYAIFMYDGKEVRTQSGSITTPFGIASLSLLLFNSVNQKFIPQRCGIGI
ncbi:hypothetical protein XENTR_v10023551 [Xenopus tropicalis]|nr:hypothetical protein XENTR_v10023551 [Xenopus tropicalis]